MATTTLDHEPASAEAWQRARTIHWSGALTLAIRQADHARACRCIAELEQLGYRVTLRPKYPSGYERLLPPVPARPRSRATSDQAA